MKKAVLVFSLFILALCLFSCDEEVDPLPGNSPTGEKTVSTFAPATTYITPALPSVTTSPVPPTSVTEAPPATESTKVNEPTEATEATEATTFTPPVTISPAPVTTTPVWPVNNPRSEVLIYLDAGHGLKDPGAVGNSGGITYYEKNLNLSVALLAKEKLEAMGYHVMMAREGDTSLLGGTDYSASYNTADEAVARRGSAKRAGASLYLSIHCNAYAGAGRAYGPIVFYNGSQSTTYRAWSLAGVFSDALTEANRAYPTAGASRIREGNSYIVLKDLTMPALLLEIGFMTDAGDLTLLCRADWQGACADAICAGVEQAYGAGLIS